MYSFVQAVAALTVGRAMDRWGRRPGLALGYVFLAAGGSLFALSMVASSPTGVLVAAALFGAGTGTGQLGRGAVAEMYPVSARGRAVGRLLLMGTVGAVGVPPLVAGLSAWGRFDPLVLAWVATTVLGAASLVCVLALRPDPRDLAVRSPQDREAVRRPLGELLHVAPFRAAVAAIALSQTAMVGIMGVAAVVIHEHGGGSTMSSSIISLHLLAMFGFAPLIGAFLDRRGRRPGLLLGTSTALAGALLAGLVEGTAPFSAGLFLVGLGWSSAYLAATAVVSDITTTSERAGVLGFMDLLVATASGVGAFAGGFLLDAGGVSALGLVMAAAIVPTLVLVWAVREESPGQWPQALSASRREATV